METHTDVACTVCGCVCDDLTLTFDGPRLVHFENACPLAEPWFRALNVDSVAPPRIHGKAAAYDDAVQAAAEILKAARAPLIYGLSRSSTPGQKAAVALAESLGAVIDTTASICHGPSIMAIQDVGESTCSLGEIKQRADLVIFWGADPVESHPRHFERYSVDPRSEFLPRGRDDRAVVVIDVEPTASSAQADVFVQVDRERDFELICGLRLAIRGEAALSRVRCGPNAEMIRELAEQMQGCRYGVVFFGLGLAQSHLGHRTVAALLELVAELNSQTRFVARRLRIPGDVTGADSVLCWQTGFPFGVDLSRGWARYNPGEFTAVDLLSRGDVDCCVIVGSESIDGFPPAARGALDSITTIVLDYPHAVPALEATVQFTTAVYGIHAAGTSYRMDEIPIPLRKLTESDLPTDERVLDDLLQRVRR
jgi:formylmethanofuran dehydrogenase subunit B